MCLGLLRKGFNVPWTCSFSWKLTIFKLLHLSVVLGKNDVNVGIYNMGPLNSQRNCCTCDYLLIKPSDKKDEKVSSSTLVCVSCCC